MNKKYYMNFEDSQDYIQKRGLDVPWNDCDVFIDERAITRTVGNVLLWADEHPIHYDGKAYLYVLHKGVEQGKKEMLEEVCEYIKENLYHAWINTSNGNTYRTQSTELFIKNLKKAMEGKK